MHESANRAMMAFVKLRIAAATAIVTGFALGIARARRTRLGVVAPDGSTVRPGSGGVRSDPAVRARAVLVLTGIRVRDTLGVLCGWRDGEEATDALVIEMTSDLATAINEHTSQAV